MSLAALSIDLDSLKYYYRIHGIPEPALHADPMYTEVPARFGELSASLDLKGTVFCVGENLAEREARAAIKDLSDAGHEIGNHSFSHDYGLAHRDFSTI